MEMQEKILAFLEKSATGDTLALADLWKCDHQKIVGAVKSLECLDDVIKAEAKSSKKWEVTDEGKEVLKSGSHESVVFHALPSNGGLPQAELMKKVGTAIGKVGFSKAMSSGWILMDKKDNNLVKRKVEKIEDTVQAKLKSINVGDESVTEKEKSELKKRKLVQELVVKSYTLSKGGKFKTKIEKAETDLTPEMLASGSWKTIDFKPYNFDSLGIQPATGHLHPLLKVRTEYRQIFLEMGFTEMPTNNFVESSFWNFDALFQPQQHPARDAHDTFFIKNPAEAFEFPPEYLERVKTVHSTGGFGSQGYGYDWKIEEARKNLLRTHTTAVSARMLYRLAQEKEFKPQKYFSIDRVFRNETLDATHLAEFHQIEGVIADRGLTLGDLIGVLYEFFHKLGIEKLRFKPAYNPYTEPSMEIFSYHEGLKKWVEIGNSGIFRPEMLRPMGLPEDVNVVAWGLSLERPTMIKYGIDNIRDLCGNRVNLKMVQDNPICRLDKKTQNGEETLVNLTEKRLNAIEESLIIISARLENIRKKNNLQPLSKEASKGLNNQNVGPTNIVISAHPKSPPLFLKVFINALQNSGKMITAKTFVHSSVKKANLSPHLIDFLALNEEAKYENLDYCISLIWKESTTNDPSNSTTLCVTPGRIVLGDVDVARYFARLLPNEFPYDNLSAHEICLLDVQLEKLQENSPKITFSDQSWLCGNAPTIADVLLWSYVKQDVRKNLKVHEKWLKKVNAHKMFKVNNM